MCMRKRKLSESGALEGLIGMTLIYSIAGYIGYYIVKELSRIARNIFKIPHKLNKFQRLLKDRSFIKDLKNVIEEEGGIHEFLDKMRPIVKHGDWDMGSIWSVRSSMFAKNVAGKYARPIIEKILITPAFKEFVKKENVTNSEIESFANGLWIILSDVTFRKFYEKLLKDAGEDVSSAIRDMTDAEKRKFFNMSDNRISLKKLIPKNI